MAITTRSSKSLTKPKPIGIEQEQSIKRDEEAEVDVESESDAELTKEGEKLMKVKEAAVKVTLPLPQIPRPPTLFSQRLKKRAKDGKFSKFIAMLRYFKPIDNIHHCSATATKPLVQKKEDPSTFTIPCTISTFEYAKALCDLGASINMMPLPIYKQLGLGIPKPTSIRLMIAHRSVRRPVSILCDILVKVDSFIFPVDFVIQDFEFKICKYMKQPRDMSVVSEIDIVDENDIEASIEERYVVETLAAVIMNFDEDLRVDYVDIINALEGMGSHSYSPKK
ncbi:hypothetical protein R3W88_026827 [Solanum pinnatisectum]|uniref:Uncharacterized protein n=1 Tax=Solanum pinnatisectum TaxID=50273 RepID=A0AAV9LFL4_9SOLN|nr:hypothetical protein R3W88_026827 [Solanum pinnatisectum]